MTTTTQTFDIQLGPFRASYRAYQTTAPEQYDGFGTISLHQSDVSEASSAASRSARLRKAVQRCDSEVRWVLIRTEHENWQVPRYRSGLFSALPFDSADPDAPSLGEVEGWIAERLYQRLTEGQDR